MTLTKETTARENPGADQISAGQTVRRDEPDNRAAPSGEARRRAGTASGAYRALQRNHSRGPSQRDDK